MFGKKGMMMGGYIAALIFGLVIGIALIYFLLSQGIISPELLGATCAPVAAP